MLVNLLIVCLIVGLIVAIIYYMPLPPPFKNIAYIIIGIILIIYLISLLTGGPGLHRGLL